MGEPRSFDFTISARAPKGIERHPYELRGIERALVAVFGPHFDLERCKFTETSIVIAGRIDVKGGERWERSASVANAAAMAQDFLLFAAHRLWRSPWLGDEGKYNDPLLVNERVTVKRVPLSDSLGSTAGTTQGSGADRG